MRRQVTFLPPPPTPLALRVFTVLSLLFCPALPRKYTASHPGDSTCQDIVGHQMGHNGLFASTAAGYPGSSESRLGHWAHTPTTVFRGFPESLQASSGPQFHTTDT
jgi:hypothetical protein